MTIGILGGGAFGTALAIALSRAGPVHLWCRTQEQAQQMQTTRQNARHLPGVVLPDSLRVTATPGDLPPCRAFLLAIPLQTLRSFMRTVGPSFDARVWVACCKGVERGTGQGPVGILHDTVPAARHAILTGPGFAADLARGLPTALTLATADPGLGKNLQMQLSTPNLRIYRTTDVTGAELGGAFKNVIAIACGAAIGAGLGESARAAVMTRGYAEMLRYATARGARAETLAGLSGLGDLALTCASPHSRNFQRGLALGRNARFDAPATVEGTATARAILADAQHLSLDLPIVRAVVALLDGKQTLEQAMASLLARPATEE